MWMSRLPHDCVFISARTGANIDELKKHALPARKRNTPHPLPYNDFLFRKYDDEDQYPET